MSSAVAMKSWRGPVVQQPPKQRASVSVLPSFVPSTPEELAQCLADPVWRICSGQLYKIMVKSPGSDDSTTIPFVPNRAQRRLLKRLWHRNIILKARQLGFTTLICILWLDHALFNADQRCGVVAHDKPSAEAIFRDKVRFAYDHLPDAIKNAIPLKRDSAQELLFTNNSSVRVATSMRSGTIHRLLVSEFGKIGAKYPEKAKEVVTGSLPAVPLDGVAVIESTAEGQAGEFYTMTQRAIATAETGRPLNPRDYRLQFAPWWEEPAYAMDPAGIVVTKEDRDYFAEVEAAIGRELTAEQRAWYVATRESDFSGDPQKMWQEYPSTPQEAFKVSTEGVYYAKQLATARLQKRIGRFPYADGIPVNTFWDIGNSDGTAIWLHQRIGGEDRFIGFIEAWGEPYSYFITELQALRYVWGTHYLPHDAEHERQQADKVAAPIDELRAMSLGGTWTTVPRVDDINHGIQVTRKAFTAYTFDEENCAAGLAHLGLYRRKWNRAQGGWGSEPNKDDGHSEAADALRQHGQGFKPPRFTKPLNLNRPARHWRA